MKTTEVERELIKNGLVILSKSIEAEIPVFKIDGVPAHAEKFGDYRRVLLFKTLVLKPREDPDSSLEITEEFKLQKIGFDKGLPFAKPLCVIVESKTQREYYVEEKLKSLNDKVINLLESEKFAELKEVRDKYNQMIQKLSGAGYSELDIKIPNILYSEKGELVLTDPFNNGQAMLFASFTSLLPGAIDHARTIDKKNIDKAAFNKKSADFCKYLLGLNKTN